MFSSVRLLATGLLALASVAQAAPLVALEERALTCVNGIYVIAARGSDGSWHKGNVTDPAYADLGGLQTIGNALTKAVGKGSYIAAVPYPASLDDYFTSLGLGIDAVQKMVKNYVDTCKAKVTPKIVLLGYSQGAQVMSSALAGGNGRKALGSAYVSSIVAGSIFADPSFRFGFEPINAGSNKNTSGLFAMDQATATSLNKVYGKVLRTYCQYFDFFCSDGSGQKSMDIHGAEVQTYTKASENFLLPLVKKFA